ncbi:hypothetical protein HK099_000822, partial [Clydaea vesicula]
MSTPSPLLKPSHIFLPTSLNSIYKSPPQQNFPSLKPNSTSNQSIPRSKKNKLTRRLSNILLRSSTDANCDNSVALQSQNISTPVNCSDDETTDCASNASSIISNIEISATTKTSHPITSDTNISLNPDLKISPLTTEANSTPIISVTEVLQTENYLLSNNLSIKNCLNDKNIIGQRTSKVFTSSNRTFASHERRNKEVHRLFKDLPDDDYYVD